MTGPSVRSPTRRFNVPVAARDGVSLATDLYLAAGEGPVRTIVGRTPYNKNTAAYPKLAERWNSRGYALVVQDVRGRGDSEGSFTPTSTKGLVLPIVPRGGSVTAPQG